MKLPYKCLIIFIIIHKSIMGLEPSKIYCFDNGDRFLKQHINWQFIVHNPKKSVSSAEQLYKWRHPSRRKIDVDTVRAQQKYYVRVLLSEFKRDNFFNIKSDQGFFISSSYNPKGMVRRNNTLRIEFLHNEIFINNRKMGSCAWIKPQAKTIFFDNHEYTGLLLLMVYRNTLLLINEVGLEDYVYCVLRTESWPGWPLEVNKAFAIASRSYAVAKVLENAAAKNKKPYHFKNTNIHQTYNGYHTNQTLLKAVHETEGIVLTYDKKPIMAMFDICCGGITPSRLSGVDFKKAPYLERTKACTFCKSCKVYRWNLEFSVEEFKKILLGRGYAVKSIESIYVASKDRAGAVQKIIIKDRNKQITIKGKEFYSLIKKIKSYCYDIEKKGGKIFISGKGYGHHLGICQWGARAMINYGYTYDQILRFYYPHTQFRKIMMR